MIGGYREEGRTKATIIVVNSLPPPPCHHSYPSPLLLLLWYQSGMVGGWGRYQFRMENETQPDLLNLYSLWLSIINVTIDQWEWINIV